VGIKKRLDNGGGDSASFGERKEKMPEGSKRGTSATPLTVSGGPILTGKEGKTLRGEKLELTGGRGGLLAKVIS